MNKKTYLLVLLSLVLFSCAHLSKNMVTRGEFSVHGGVYKKNEWRNVLNFNRISWYQELTLLFDMHLAKIESDSPFTKWFSPVEMKTFESCQNFYIGLLYALDSQKISYQMFLNEMEKNGYERVLVQEFTRHFKLHPDYEKSSLDLYKIDGFCLKKGEEKKEKSIGFPGFKDILLE